MILGLETSCDETAAACLDGSGRVLSNVIASQDAHRLYGGVVPEIASREHVRRLLPVIGTALTDAGAELADVDRLAVTAGPGLVGSLLVGLTAAKGLALSRGLPWIGVNHLEGHVLSPFLEDPDCPTPTIVLVASGGHTLLVLVRSLEDTQVIGRTRDDACGEAFDKVAVLLGLGYPGGARVEKLAEGGDPDAFDFPRAWLEPDTLDFSFSGVKTAVRVALEREADLTGGDGARNVAASFQSAVIEVLVARTLRAAERHGCPAVAVSGGVAANGALRRAMEAACAKRRLRLVVPRAEYCGDNAAMIAYAGKLRMDRGERSPWTLDADPNLPLGQGPNRAPRRKRRR